jgi:hypothetical protein
MKAITLILVYCLISCVVAQSKISKNLIKANALYESNKILEASIYYKKCINSDISHYYAISRLGLCYKKLNKAEDAVRVFSYMQNRSVLPDSLLDTYYYCLKKSSQTKNLDLFWKQIKNDSISLIYEAQIDSIKKLTSNSGKVKIAMVKGANSSFSEICPVIHPTKGLVFLSNREGILIKKRYGATGMPAYNIYAAHINNDSLSVKQPKLFSGEINSKLQEGGICFSSDCKQVLYSRAYEEYDKSYKFKLYMSEKKRNTWTGLKEFAFNDSTASFTHPNFSTDGSMFFFSSDKKGGYGGKDIYVCLKIDSLWSDPINLGPKINTCKNEIFPFYSKDGELYFSSDGHLTIGGYDIFKASQTNGDWANIENLKAPINTKFDEFSYYIFQNNSKKAYFSSNKPGGKGQEDIYICTWK